MPLAVVRYNRDLLFKSSPGNGMGFSKPGWSEGQGLTTLVQTTTAVLSSSRIDLFGPVVHCVCLFEIS